MVSCGGTTLADFHLIADSSTTAARIPILFAGGCWASLLLRNCVRYVPIAWKLKNSWSAVKLIPWRISLNGRFLHNHWVYSNSVFSGGCWARRQLRNGIRFVPIAWKLRKSWSAVGLISWRISLNGRFLNNGCTDSNSVCWRLLGSSLATQQYKVRPYRMKTQEVIVSCGTNTLVDFT